MICKTGFLKDEQISAAVAGPRAWPALVVSLCPQAVQALARLEPERPDEAGPFSSGARGQSGRVRLLQELARGCGVADGSRGVDAEDGGEVEGIGAVGEGFLKLAVDA